MSYNLPHEIARLMKRGVPTVDLTMSRPDIDVPRVTSDHEAIGRLAAKAAAPLKKHLLFMRCTS